MSSLARFFGVLVCLLLVHFSCLAAEQGRKLVVLFTSDLHSQILPQKDGSGSIARIATIVEQERSRAEQEGAAFVLLDGGDIAMGDIFHTLFPTEAVEYRALARIGYDAFTYGNHDFDFGAQVLGQMFSSAHSKETSANFPKLLSTNVRLSVSDSHIPAEGHILIERNGVKTGLLGVMGENSWNVIADGTGSLSFSDPVESSRKAVEALKAKGADYIVAISHGGALNGDDVRLARKVKGIDFIISAHDHQLLRVPMKAGGTYIGAAGAYGKWVGKAVFNNGELDSYEILDVTGEIPMHPQVGQWADSMSNVVARNFMELSGRGVDDTLAVLDTASPKYVDEDGMMPLGSNVAASYAAAAGKLLQDVPQERIIGVVPYGMVRRGLESGAVTCKDAFEVLSLGENESGYTGYPLVYAWLTGRELEELCEMNVSVSPYLEDMRLFFSGLQYRYNSARLPFMRVDRVKAADGRVGEDQLYMIVTDSYTASMIGLLEKKSYGLLSAQPKDREGRPLLPDSLPCLRGDDGNQVPGWAAFAEYLQQGGFNPYCGADSVENDDFVPLGYTLLAILVCAVAVSCIGRKRELR